MTAPLTQGIAGAPGSIVERAAAILRAEVEAGALSNVASAQRAWSSQRPRLLESDLMRRMQSDLVSLIDPLLDLLSPRQPSREPSRVSPEPSVGRLPTFRPARALTPGESATLDVALQNDDSRPVELGLICSDLANLAATPAAGARQCIPAACLRLAPARLRIAPQGVGRVVISLDIPVDARPGTYRALLHSPELTDLCAFVLVTISPSGAQEEQMMR